MFCYNAYRSKNKAIFERRRNYGIQKNKFKKIYGQKPSVCQFPQNDAGFHLPLHLCAFLHDECGCFFESGKRSGREKSHAYRTFLVRINKFSYDTEQLFDIMFGQLFIFPLNLNRALVYNIFIPSIHAEAFL